MMGTRDAMGGEVYFTSKNAGEGNTTAAHLEDVFCRFVLAKENCYLRMLLMLPRSFTF